MNPLTVTFGTPSRAMCACTSVPLDCLVLYDRQEECAQRANHKYVLYDGMRDRGQLLKTIRLFSEMLLWRPHSEAYFKIDDDVCDITVRMNGKQVPCFIGVAGPARHPPSFRYARGAAYGISNHAARRLQTEDLFLLLMEYSQKFQRLRKLEALNTIHEDAFIGYFIRYRLKCTINGTIKYSHRKRANCTKQLKWIERQAR